MEYTLGLLLLQILTSFGFQGVILVVVAILLLKHSDKLFNSSKELFKRRKKRAENSQLINIILLEMSIKLDADKLAIFEFHNGGSNLSGLPFLHFSLTQLRGKLGIPEFNKNFENMQRTAAIDFFRELNHTDIMHINGAKDIEYNFPTLSKQFELEEIKYAVAINLYGIYDTIGFLVIAFNNREEPLNEEEELFVLKEQQKIAALLDLKNNK